MKEKPTCEICFAKFTRRSNMRRHMGDVHGASSTAIKMKTPGNWTHNNKFDSGVKAEVKGDTLTAFDRELARLSEVTRYQMTT